MTPFEFGLIVILLALIALVLYLIYFQKEMMGELADAIPNNVFATVVAFARTGMAQAQAQVGATANPYDDILLKMLQEITGIEPDAPPSGGEGNDSPLG